MKALRADVYGKGGGWGRVRPPPRNYQYDTLLGHTSVTVVSVKFSGYQRTLQNAVVMKWRKNEIWAKIKRRLKNKDENPFFVKFSATQRTSKIQSCKPV